MDLIELELLAELIRSEVQDENIQLERGSPSSGRVWRLRYENGRDIFGLGDGYLGMNKREAGVTLKALYAGLRFGKEMRR